MLFSIFSNEGGSNVHSSLSDEESYCMLRTCEGHNSVELFTHDLLIQSSAYFYSTVCTVAHSRVVIKKLYMYISSTN